MAQMSEAPVAPTTTSRAGARPFTLYVLVALIVAKSILIMLVLGGAFANEDIRIGQLMRMPNVAAFIRETPGATALLFLLAATLLVSALLLLADRRVGWLLAMIITGVSVAVDIAAFLAGTGSELWMFLNVVTVFYLNQRDIRQRVGATLEPVIDVPQQAGS
jgi:hypothetical protein